jgi:hypothetical protein
MRIGFRFNETEIKREEIIYRSSFAINLYWWEIYVVLVYEIVELRSAFAR